MRERTLSARDRLRMDGLAVLYVVANATAAQCGGGYYLFFPGLAALSHDTLSRPWGKWASQPWRLIVTPALAAALGTAITRAFPYRVLTVLLVVAGCLLLLALLRSSISPAIAAGTLPLVLGIKSWFYPASTALGLIALVSIVWPWQKRYRRRYRGTDQASARGFDGLRGTSSTGYKWILPFFLFLTVMASCAALSGFRLILFPPLIVMAYEMFAHPTSCSWAERPLAFPTACCLTALGGWLAVSVFGSGGTAAGCAMLVGVGVLRLLHLNLPPVLAIGLLPLVIDSPGLEYPLYVSIGTAALTVVFLLYRRWVVGHGQAPVGGDVPGAGHHGR